MQPQRKSRITFAATARVESRGIRATPRDSFAGLRKRRSFSWNRENIYDSTTQTKEGDPRRYKDDVEGDQHIQPRERLGELRIPEYRVHAADRRQHDGNDQRQDEQRQ